METRITVIDGQDGHTPDMLRGPNTRPPDHKIHRLFPTRIKRSNVWPAPAGERFVKIYGGELDGMFHSSSGWYQACTLDGNLRYLEWMEAQ
jgi:hypothetical protein